MSSEDFLIIENKRINNDYYLLELKSKNKLQNCHPGQFVQVLIDHTTSVFLRRPISIYNVDYKENTLSLLIQIVGEGTSVLSERKAGETVNLLYPLGYGFSLIENQRVLLVGGGVGVAPLLLLGKELAKLGNKVVFLLGGRATENILELKKFEQFGEVWITTEDGSMGEKGFVTHHSGFVNAQSTDFAKVYCCGPHPMMKAVATLSKEKNFDCEVSLENLMACGIGSCLCCVEDTVAGHKCVCTEGPVFNTTYLKW